MRFTASGVLDSTFNGTGMVFTSFPTSPGITEVVALQADGKILVAGYCVPSGSNEDFCVVRYTTNGILDTTFNGTGIVATGFDGRNDRGKGLAVQTDGKIVVAGYSSGGVWKLLRGGALQF